MGSDDFENLFSLEKVIHETVEKETDLSEDYFIGGLFLERDDDEEIPKRRRGRPKGVKESAPRKPVSRLKEIREHLSQFIENLKRLEEVIKKEGSKYVLYSKDKKKKLGTFKTKKEAQKREKQIQSFKKRG